MEGMGEGLRHSSDCHGLLLSLLELVEDEVTEGHEVPRVHRLWPLRFVPLLAFHWYGARPKLTRFGTQSSSGLFN